MIKEDILVSVIVPIYNVEQYLAKCIQSICEQTHKNIEIILVDDGSTDQSKSICDKYDQIDNRIKIIHKRNGGITSARKAGVAIARGSYVGFVDGDDWIDSNMYEELLSEAVKSGAQIVLSDMYRHKFTGEVTIWSGADLPEKTYVLDRDRELISACLISGISSKNKGINGGVHVKLFERSLLCKHIFCIDDIVHGFADDKVIVYPALLHATKIRVIHKAFYHGVDRKDSATHSVNYNFFEQMQWVYTYLRSVFEEELYGECLLKQLNDFVMISSITNINRLSGQVILPEYFLPNLELLKGKDIVLYGAGRVGQSFYRQIKAMKICNIIRWVDIKFDKRKNVYPIKSILETVYDYVVIAMMERSMAEIVSKNLEDIGILKSKILWVEANKITEYYLQGDS